MRLRTAILVAAVLTAVTPGANALLYTSVLTGEAERPNPVTTTGSGTASVDFDVVAHRMTVKISFQDLLAGTSVAHIHCCTTPAQAFAGVATTEPTFPGFPVGVLSGNYAPTAFDTLAASTYHPNFLAANGGTPASAEAALKFGLDNGLAYFNVHSSMFPGGEIRGNLTPIPEPSSVALMALGLGALAWVVRRRRKD